MIYAKSLKLNDQVATIKLEGFTNPSVTRMEIDTEVKALYALLGGYNEVARGVDVDEFRELQRQFKTVVSEMAGKIMEAK